MNKTAFFLAQRMALGNAYQKGISIMTIICFAGIFIGSFSLALVTAIMHGFEIAIHTKMQGIHSHIIIQAEGEEIDINPLAYVLRNEFPEIKAFSPSVLRHVLISTKKSEHETPTVAMIKGIDPVAESNTSIISQKIIAHLPAQKFSQLFMNNHLIIGKQCAHNKSIVPGDTIELLFAREQQTSSNKIIFESHQAIVSGIFDTGIDEFDSSVVYCSLSFLEELFPNAAIEQINVNLKPNTNESAVIEKLQKRLGLDVFSWKDLYPALVATLTLEKYVSFFILALILLVASMNILSLLFMHINQKRTDIALLKSMGMPDHSISIIFFTMGMFISCTASTCGLIAACCTSWLLNRYPFIQLPDTYYVTHLPVAMSWHIIIAVFLVVLIFSFFATWFPVQRIKSINVSQVLRFEK